MVPIAVQKIIIGSAPGPSILVLQPIEESPVRGVSRIVPIMVGAAEAAQLHLAITHTKVARPTTHDLLLDAVRRARLVSDQVGARALVVDPLDDGARSFYARYGFRDMPGTCRMFARLERA